jgi:hypothetical protein
MEERHTQKLFQILNLFAYAALGQSKVVGCLGEIHIPRSGFKGVQCSQRREITPHHAPHFHHEFNSCNRDISTFFFCDNVIQELRLAMPKTHAT